MSTKNTLRRIPVLGIILIAVGLVLLLDQINLMNLTFWNIVTGILILYGAVLVIRSFNNGDRGKVFWGTLLFLLGLYFMLDNMNMITTRYPVFLPAIFLILGFSFFMMYVYQVSDWHLLIPTVFFIGIGAIIIAGELSLFDVYHIEEYLYNYWPVLLILFGIGLVVKSRRRRRLYTKTAVERDVIQGV